MPDVQWIATISIENKAFDFNRGLFTEYMALVGTIVGMFGVVTAWHLSWLQVGSLFFGPLVIIGVIHTMGAGVQKKFLSRS